MWPYSSSHPEELSFERGYLIYLINLFIYLFIYLFIFIEITIGELIKIIWDDDLHWCQGESLETKKVGWFPANLVAFWDQD